MPISFSRAEYSAVGRYQVIDTMPPRAGGGDGDVAQGLADLRHEIVGLEHALPVPADLCDEELLPRAAMPLA